MKRLIIVVSAIIALCFDLEAMKNTQRFSTRATRKQLKQHTRDNNRLEKIRSPRSIFKKENLKAQNRRLLSQNYSEFTLPEIVLDTTRFFGPAPDDQMFVDVSYDGTNYFVVWMDERNYDIYGARMSKNGVLLDTLGIPICVAENSQGYPAVAFDGANYFVVWEDARNWESDIYVARVSTNGVVLDPNGIELINQPDDRFEPHLAKGPGQQLLLVFSGYVPQYGATKILAALYPSAGISQDNKILALASKLKIYPNPCSKIANIQLTLNKESNLKIELIDIAGKCLKNLTIGKFPIGTHTIRLKTDELTAGVYFLKVISNEKTFNEWIVKVR